VCACVRACTLRAMILPLGLSQYTGIRMFTQRKLSSLYRLIFSFHTPEVSFWATERTLISLCCVCLTSYKFSGDRLHPRLDSYNSYSHRHVPPPTPPGPDTVSLQFFTVFNLPHSYLLSDVAGLTWSTAKQKERMYLGSFRWTPH
jgi:hypothetical protein